MDLAEALGAYRLGAAGPLARFTLRILGAHAGRVDQLECAVAQLGALLRVHLGAGGQ